MEPGGSSGMFWLCFFGLYLLPAILASSRNHRNTGAITALNLLLGWTVIGWILSLVWAVTATKETVPPGPHADSGYEERRSLSYQQSTGHQLQQPLRALSSNTFRAVAATFYG